MASVNSEHQVKEIYKFTPEEMRVLKECNNESFYYRSLPLGSVFGTLAYYGVKLGYMKGSSKWGAVPKVLVAATAGYFAGKLSYQSTCAEKIMKLPNSRLADALRQRKGRSPLFEDGFSSAPVDMGSSIPTDAETKNHLDSMQEMRAEDRSYDAPPSAVGLDDTFRPSMDSFSVSDQPLPPPSQTVASYDDLRRMNREEYDQKRVAAYNRNVAPTPSPQERPAPIPPRRSPAPPGSAKNAYGDVWEE